MDFLNFFENVILRSLSTNLASLPPRLENLGYCETSLLAHLLF